MNTDIVPNCKLIKVYVEFKWFGSIDTVNERFQAGVLIESKWFSDELVTEYNPNTDWNPKIEIENASFEKINEENEYEIEMIDNKTLITEKRYVQGNLILCALDLLIYINLRIDFLM